MIVSKDYQLELPSGIAIDFGGTKISASKILKGEIIKNIQISTEKDLNVDDQIACISKLIENLKISDSDKIGVAVTGRIDESGDWYSVNDTTLVKIQSAPLQKKLSEKFKRNVRVMNDAIAAASGEYIAGSGKGFSSIGYITISTGIGGGFILRGVPLTSKQGLANHIGFTTSRIATDFCGSGRVKTIESIASGRAMAKLAEEKGYTNFDAKKIYAEYLLGKDWAKQIIMLSAEAIAELCANIQSTLDPEIIILGGSIGLADGYLTLVEKFLQNEPEIFRSKLKPSSLGVNASKIGVLKD